MLARVKEFDGDDDRWPGWWLGLHSFLKATHLGHKGMIERIAQETGATNLNTAVLSSADKKLSSSLYYVLGLTMTDESKSLKIARNVPFEGGAIALHKLLPEYRPDIVNRHLGLLISTMNWSIRATDPVTAINELDLRIAAYELQSGERMADTVKRGVLLKGLAPLAEVQKTRGEGFGKTEFVCANESRSGGSSSCGSRAPRAHGCRRSLHEWPRGKGEDER